MWYLCDIMWYVACEAWCDTCVMPHLQLSAQYMLNIIVVESMYNSMVQLLILSVNEPCIVLTPFSGHVLLVRIVSFHHEICFDKYYLCLISRAFCHSSYAGCKQTTWPFLLPTARCSISRAVYSSSHYFHPCVIYLSSCVYSPVYYAVTDANNSINLKH